MRRRQMLVRAGRRLRKAGLNDAAEGNLSVRVSDGLLITPSAVPWEDLRAEDLVVVGPEGGWTGRQRPSSEWRLHQAILQTRPEIGAVVHAHATFATSLSCLRRDIPPFHYMIAVAGGTDIRCAPYATFGTAELAQYAVQALEGRKACLLANHGMVALGADLDLAVALAAAVERLCEQYWRACQVGEPVLLDDAEMDEILRRFEDYGR